MDGREVAVTGDVQALRLTVAEQADHLDSLRARLEEMAKRQVELRRLLLEAHESLVERDAEIERVRGEMVEEIRRDLQLKDGEIAHRGEVIAELQAAVAAMEQTRLWRTGQRFWRFRDAIRGRR
jgi:uncharacterized protein involved in exopolysaccharide biosynthesis